MSSLTNKIAIFIDGPNLYVEAQEVSIRPSVIIVDTAPNAELPNQAKAGI